MDKIILDVQFEKRGHVFRIFSNEELTNFISVDGVGEHAGFYNKTMKSFKTKNIFMIDEHKVNNITIPDDVCKKIEAVKNHNEKWEMEKPYRDALAKAIETGERVAYYDESYDVTGYFREIHYAHPDGRKEIVKIKGY